VLHHAGKVSRILIAQGRGRRSSLSHETRSPRKRFRLPRSLRSNTQVCASCSRQLTTAAHNADSVPSTLFGNAKRDLHRLQRVKQPRPKSARKPSSMLLLTSCSSRATTPRCVCTRKKFDWFRHEIVGPATKASTFALFASAEIMIMANALCSACARNKRHRARPSRRSCASSTIRSQPSCANKRKGSVS